MHTTRKSRQQFHQLDAPFDDNTVYSTHNYVEPGLSGTEYPGEIHGQAYDRARLDTLVLTNWPVAGGCPLAQTHRSG